MIRLGIVAKFSLLALGRENAKMKTNTNSTFCWCCLSDEIYEKGYLHNKTT